jgi:hypothetical protein
LLRPRHTPDASVIPTENGWHLETPAGEAGSYRLAQMDDYVGLPRSRFPLSATSILSLRCRVSEPALTPGPSPQGRGGLPGTWGFGFWNDPFAFSFGLQGRPRRLPTLPNACWFFHASAENYLSFAPEVRRTNPEKTTEITGKSPALAANPSNLVRRTLPGNGFLAQTFRSPKISPLLLTPGILGLPLFFSKTFSKCLRAVAGKIIDEDNLSLNIDVTQWHTYSLSWRESGVAFSVDGAVVFETLVSPRGPLGLVIWIDNQYAAWTPEGRISMGTLQQKTAGWMEIEQVEVKSEN